MKSNRTLLPLLVIAIALGLTFALVKTRKVPKPHEVPHLGPLVEVLELTKASRQVVVSGTGTAQSSQEVSITPQVKGRVSELSPGMVAGGTFRQGELLFAIEDVDYRLAIDLARASLAQAELELLRNQKLAEVARAEWRALNPHDSSEPDPLVVYEPQLNSARAQRAAAQASLFQAELNLQRTRLFAPFNGYVRSEQLEIGQFVNAGSPVATVVGTDQVEIIVPLPLDELAWLQVPRAGVPAQGSPARVVLNAGGQSYRWQGRLTRALGEIDPRNRMARVVVTVAAPSSRNAAEGNLLHDLQPGMFVEVELQGEVLTGVVAVPRGAVRDGDTLWLADRDNRLQIRAVEILRRERDVVLVTKGLDGGERLVMTNLVGAAEGLQLRPQLQEARQ